MIPAAMRRRHRHVLAVVEDGSKRPYQVRHPRRMASVDDPTTWASYDEAVEALRNGHGTHLGFVLTNNIGAFDIDGCRDPETGAFNRVARKITALCRSYTEVTVSQRGIRVIGFTRGDHVHCKIPIEDGSSVEIYRRASRFIVMTGDDLYGFGLRNIDGVIDEIVAEYGVPTRRSPQEVDASIDGFEELDWRDVVREVRAPVRKFMGPVHHDRSGVIFRIGMTLHERGATPAQIAAVLAASEAFRDKHGNDMNALSAEVARIVAKGERDENS